MALFVLIRTLTYVGLLCAALWLNRQCWRSLTLTCVVGANIFVPIPAADTPTLWYLQCIFADSLVIALAFMLRAQASTAVIACMLLLCACHMTGVVLGPQPGFGPYRIAVPLFEATALLSCCLLSDAMMRQLGHRLTGRLKS